MEPVSDVFALDSPLGRRVPPTPPIQDRRGSSDTDALDPPLGGKFSPNGIHEVGLSRVTLFLWGASMQEIVSHGLVHSQV